nr:AAA family ATPase [Kaumoebavirus]
MSDNIVSNLTNQLLPLILYQGGSMSWKTLMLFIINNFLPRIETFIKKYIESYFAPKEAPKSLPPPPERKVKLELSESIHVLWYCAQANEGFCDKYRTGFGLVKNGATLKCNKYTVTAEALIEETGSIIYEGKPITLSTESKKPKPIAEQEIQVTWNHHRPATRSENEFVYVLEGESMKLLLNFVQYCSDRYADHHTQMYNNQSAKFVSPTISTFTEDRGGDWIFTTLHVNKTFDNVVMDPKIKNILTTKLQRMQDESYYNRVGKPLKTAFLFYGLPGCGKSSTIYAIAKAMKGNIYQMDLSKMNDALLLKGIRNIPANSVIVMEEIDLQHYKREGEGKGVTLGCLLRVMDGYEYLHKCVVVMTTNHIEKIDPALIRPGRVDCKIEFKKATSVMIREVIKLYLEVDYTGDLSGYDGKYTTSELMEKIESATNVETFIETL